VKTLKAAIDQYMSWPTKIYRRDGKIAIRDSKSLIKKGRVRVNGFTCMNEDQSVNPGDEIKFGPRRERMQFLVP